MTKQLFALLWLRRKILLTNKSILVQILMPFILPIIFRIMSQTTTMPLEILTNYLGMTLLMCMTMGLGGVILAILAEEKEKRTLNMLLISGVKYNDYIISTLILPIILIIIAMTIFPLVLKVNIMPYIGAYMLIVFLTSVTIILLFLLCGFIVKTQVTGQVVTVFISLTLVFSSTFVSFNEVLQNIIDFTFLGAFSHVFSSQTPFYLSEHSLQLGILIIWMIALFILNRIAITKSITK